MTPHTPGPWTYDYSPNHSGMHPSFMILGPNVTVVADVSRDPERGVIGAQVEANARLIAAAPDMFDALCELVDDEVCRLDHHGYCQAHSLGRPCGVGLGREALARAKGQKP